MGDHTWSCQFKKTEVWGLKKWTKLNANATMLKPHHQVSCSRKIFG
ncbi:hypothetical protein ES288_A11G098300v1 [Gossypium darwinii]|uniref:Uncharacterized protein n=1 Tax=Gossypium darwinii TaxID=34276 RepID=A0A5D2EJA2_GOSDA|nr:hypothetical protein ES288_A11G098300v1 [Gossypium darwinii]